MKKELKFVCIGITAIALFQSLVQFINLLVTSLNLVTHRIYITGYGALYNPAFFSKTMPFFWVAFGLAFFALLLLAFYALRKEKFLRILLPILITGFLFTMIAMIFIVNANLPTFEKIYDEFEYVFTGIYNYQLYEIFTSNVLSFVVSTFIGLIGLFLLGRQKIESFVEKI